MLSHADQCEFLDNRPDRSARIFFQNAIHGAFGGSAVKTCETILGTMDANLPLRIARAAVFTVVCLILAAAAHWFAGGATPTPRVLLFSGLVIMTITVAVAGRERSPGTVIGLLCAGQAFLHVLFGSTEAPAGLSRQGRILSDLPQHGLGVSVGMLTAHLTAVLLTGWWLSRGEAALWSLLRGIGTYALRRVAALLVLLHQDAVPKAFVVPLQPIRGDIRPLRDRVLRHAMIRRGPPILRVV
ncbi:MFS transporter [Thermostaphylospora chromogena]|uniref:MFS transporter n=1 Tax=Thermostaphylospora chromogena TaxID=35622 RepID=UPI001041F89C|nr:MFS transporter [Thermostaphylospora chromogena]